MKQFGASNHIIDTLMDYFICLIILFHWTYDCFMNKGNISLKGERKVVKKYPIQKTIAANLK